MDKNQEIFHSTVIRTVLKKMLKSKKVDQVIPIQLDSLRSRFVDEAKKLQFKFPSKDTVDLCQGLFVMSFFVSLASDHITDREIEGIFTIVAQAMDIHHLQRGYAFFWFNRGCKIADEERKTFQYLVNGAKIYVKLGGYPILHHFLRLSRWIISSKVWIEVFLRILMSMNNLPKVLWHRLHFRAAIFQLGI